MLVDHELSGVVVGQTLATRAEDIYRALLEATAFGTRVIIETFTDAGVPVTELVIAGGLVKNALLMQIYADVSDLPLSVIGSEQGPALGSAIHAAVAAGAYPDIRAAAAAMGRCAAASTTPMPATSRSTTSCSPSTWSCTTTSAAAATMSCTACASTAVPRLAGGSELDDPPPQSCASTVAELHAELTRYDLVIWTAGNVSARVPGADLLVIKPSGVSYDELEPRRMVVTDLDGNVVEGELAPSSDTAAHAYVYRHMPEVGGVVHTHSTYATAWAARGEPIPCVLTMMADEFGGEIPVGPFALIGDDSIGRGIVETLRGHRSPAVLMRNHGVFTIGATPRGRGQGRGDVRGRRPHRAHRPPARQARRRSTRSDIDRLYDRYQNVYGQQPKE